MSLPQLVNYFNNKFAQEHQCDFHPFLLSNNKVTGIFGIARIKSEFSPIRSVANPDLIAGYAARAFSATDNTSEVKTAKIKRLLTKTLNKPAHVRSIVSFDRLCRTVHVLNYLALASESDFLITEVDPRHILAVPDNHGVYFEQIIVRSGLKTENIVISMSIIDVHQLHYPKLLKGLTNYRELGYKIALNIGDLISADKAINLIKQLAPDYIIVTAPNKNYLESGINAVFLNSLAKLKELAKNLGGKIIMQNFEQSEQIAIGKTVDFDLLLGDFYQGYIGSDVEHVREKALKFPSIPF